jgi:outer membrane lipopolysaccharide assembly protein LptE/RlpB
LCAGLNKTKYILITGKFDLTACGYQLRNKVALTDMDIGPAINWTQNRLPLVGASITHKAESMDKCGQLTAVRLAEPFGHQIQSIQRL